MLYLPAPPPPPDYTKLFQRYGGHVERVDELARYGGFSVPDTGFYTIQFHGKMQGLFQSYRYKVLEGGRGGTKSWAVARALIIISLQKKLRIVCAREFQNTVADSVHKLLVDQINSLGLQPWFRVTAKHIYSSNGSEFVFMGLGDLGKTSNRAKIKSFEGCDICWVEEAEAVTKETWNVLLPTIRKAGSEIWVVYNPCNESDATYQMFHENEPPGALIIKINWRDNFWISKEMLQLKDYNFATDPEAADHIWDGNLKQHAEATIFRKKYIVEDFVTPQFIMSYDKKGKLVETPIRFFHAIDWGFANDPLTMVRFYMTEEPAGKYGGDDCIAGTHLWIDAECWGIGVEINEMVAPHPGALLANGKPYFFEKIPTYRQWPVKADCARPELISYVRNKGINITGAEKWDGSVEDGIAHMRGFIKIHIHKTKCPRACDEFANYRYKVDKITGDILPQILDKSNHCIAEGERVQTSLGLTPIEEVRVGDLVQTRAGLRQVLRAWKTQESAELWEVKAGHKSLRCTSNHEIFTVLRGFIRADSLRYDDYILVDSGDGLWHRLKMWFSMAKRITSTQGKDITDEATNSFIGSFGPPCEAQSQKAGKSIIGRDLSKARLIPTISTAWKLRNTGSTMPRIMSSLRANWSTLRLFARLLKHGTPHLRDERSIVKSVDSPTSPSFQLRRRVSSASRISSRKRLDTKTDSVAINASLPIGARVASIMKRALVLIAQLVSSPIATLMSGVVPEPVRSSSATKKHSSVFELTIQDQHEFVVEGILVRNCIDAVRYGLDGYIKHGGELDVWRKLGGGR